MIAFKAQRRFAALHGDHLTMLNVYLGYMGQKKNKKQWCFDNFINGRAMDTVVNTRKQVGSPVLHTREPFDLYSYSKTPI